MATEVSKSDKNSPESTSKEVLDGVVGYDFSDIRPFHDEEVRGVIEELCKVPYFLGLLNKIFPSVPREQIVAKLKRVNTIKEFQEGFIIPFLTNLAGTTTDGITASGTEHLDPAGGYLFLSNHRDIILDSAFMNVKLNEVGLTTTEIAIGDNLLIYDWITDLVKLNKSFVVKRGLPGRQQMVASENLSAYIRDSIVNRHQNIWLAQREGRAKDGDDRTQTSVLKMLNLTGSGSTIDKFRDLNIVPVSITYEYQLKRDNADYHKSKSEDLMHMSTGLYGRKGHVHFAFGEPINPMLGQIAELNRNAQITLISEMIDRQIHLNYVLWPCNYIAYDEFLNTNKYADRYEESQKAEFNEYIDEHIHRLDGCDEEFVRREILRGYANPLINQEKAIEG